MVEITQILGVQPNFRQWSCWVLSKKYQIFKWTTLHWHYDHPSRRSMSRAEVVSVRIYVNLTIIYGQRFSKFSECMKPNAYAVCSVCLCLKCMQCLFCVLQHSSLIRMRNQANQTKICWILKGLMNIVYRCWTACANALKFTCIYVFRKTGTNSWNIFDLRKEQNFNNQLSTGKYMGTNLYILNIAQNVLVIKIPIDPNLFHSLMPFSFHLPNTLRFY